MALTLNTFISGLIKVFLKSLGTSPFLKIIFVIFSTLFLTSKPPYLRNSFTILSESEAYSSSQNKSSFTTKVSQTFSFSSISFPATVSWFYTLLFLLFPYHKLWPVPVFNWGNSGLATPCQFINTPVKYFTIMPSSCIFQILDNFIHGLHFMPP